MKSLTEEQLREAADAYRELGNKKKAAKSLNLKYSTFRNRLNKAVDCGYAVPADPNQIPEGWLAKQYTKGHLEYNDDGKMVGATWTKMTRDDEKRKEIMEAGIQALTAKLEPLEPVEAPVSEYKDLMNAHVLTDAHVGMMAWHEEGGSNWDLKIAEKTIFGAMKHSIDHAPNAHTGLIVQLGDYMHFDGLEPKTPTHGHILDTDSRFGKIVAYALDILRRTIDYALRKYENVRVIIAEGNHDLASSVWMRTAFAMLYRDEPRVEIIMNQLPYYCITWGKAMIAAHHGHVRKLSDFMARVPAIFPIEWGSAEFRYAMMGHFHHSSTIESNGIKGETFPTLAAKDAHASRHGYFAERFLPTITYHKKYGEVARSSTRPEMFLPEGFAD